MTERKRKWLVPVVMKSTVYENATAIVKAKSAEAAKEKVWEYDYEDLLWDTEEIDRQIEIQDIHRTRQVEEVT